MEKLLRAARETPHGVTQLASAGRLKALSVKENICCLIYKPVNKCELFHLSLRLWLALSRL